MPTLRIGALLVVAACLASCAIVHPVARFGLERRDFQTSHFAIRTDLVVPTPSELGQTAEGVRADVLALFPDAPVSFREETIDLFVFQQREDFREYARAHRAEDAEGFCCWFGETALYHPIAGITITRDREGRENSEFSVDEEQRREFRRRLAHELTHRMLRGGATGALPDWAEEGLCEWVGDQVVVPTGFWHFTRDVHPFIVLLHGVPLFERDREGLAPEFEYLPLRRNWGKHMVGRMVVSALASDTGLRDRLRESLSRSLKGSTFYVRLLDRFRTCAEVERFVVSRYQAAFLRAFREALVETPELLVADEYAALARLLTWPKPASGLDDRLRELEERARAGEDIRVTGLLGEDLAGLPETERAGRILSRWTEVAYKGWVEQFGERMR